MKISGAQAVVECLREQGVDTVFGYPGGTVLPLYDALYNNDDIKHILTVHEQGAAHAADGYARASGRVGVCIATSGPGATNLVTGLAAAFMDSIPVVAITGQVATNLIGRDAFQEVDIAGITLPITKHNFQVKNVAELPVIMRRAFRIASSGRPGPVLVDIPRDLQMAQFEFIRAEGSEGSEYSLPECPGHLIAAAARAIQAARRPVVIIGGGVITAEASHELEQLVDKCSLPVVSTLMGLGGFNAHKKQFLGLTGLHGHKVANSAIQNADTIIAVGTRFSDRVTGDPDKYSEGKTVIHLDVDPAEIDKNITSHIGLIGDIKKLLTGLSAIVEPPSVTVWWQELDSWRQEYQYHYTSEVLTAPWIMRHMAEQTAGGDYIFATDVGQHQMWAAQHLAISRPRTWLTSGGLGAMGFGLPAALGAQFAAPDKRVIHICGDGGFKMTGAELYTVANHDLPIISIIINNNCLGLIRQLQHAFFAQRYTVCQLPQTANLAMFARAFGIEAATVATCADFRAAFAWALAAKRPAVIVANINSEHMVTPMLDISGTDSNYIDLS